MVRKSEIKIRKGVGLRIGIINENLSTVETSCLASLYFGI
jgi:hypothetical protein